MTLEYATREGARTGAALANGIDRSSTASQVDDEVVAARPAGPDRRTAPQVDLSHVTEIRIYDADANGDEQGLGRRLAARATGRRSTASRSSSSSHSGNWDACTRAERRLRADRLDRRRRSPTTTSYVTPLGSAARARPATPSLHDERPHRHGPQPRLTERAATHERSPTTRRPDEATRPATRGQSWPDPGHLRGRDHAPADGWPPLVIDVSLVLGQLPEASSAQPTPRPWPAP